MPRRTRVAWTALGAGLVVLVLALLVWLSTRPADRSLDQPDSFDEGPARGPVLRLGLIPERDIFAQRRRYRVLADYLSERLHRRIELVTVNTYSGVLEEFEDQRIDAAFVGSMVAVLAQDRYQTRVLVKPVMPGGVSTYRGTLVVRADSPYEQVSDLGGESVALVRTTTAGNLFPIALFVERDMLGPPDGVRLHWAGTHDEAVRELADGRVEAAAVKDLRFEAIEKADRSLAFRRLATSASVPNNALIVHRGMTPLMAERLSEALLGMHATETGRAALSSFGAERFVPCSIEEYAPIYTMLEQLGGAWDQLGIEGAPPRRPVELRREGGRG